MSDNKPELPAELPTRVTHGATQAVKYGAIAAAAVAAVGTVAVISGFGAVASGGFLASVGKFVGLELAADTSIGTGVMATAQTVAMATPLVAAGVGFVRGVTDDEYLRKKKMDAIADWRQDKAIAMEEQRQEMMNARLQQQNMAQMQQMGLQSGGLTPPSVGMGQPKPGRIDFV